MSINFTSKNVKLTGALKAFTENNLQSIEKISGDIIDAEITVNEEKLDLRVVMSVKTKMHSYQIEEKDPILKQALRKACNTLKAQAKKQKEKITKDKKRTTKEGMINLMADEENEGPKPESEKKVKKTASADKITVSNNFSLKPLSIEEAIFFLKESGENAYMFPNVETTRMSVIFYDNEKNISIIEAK